MPRSPTSPSIATVGRARYRAARLLLDAPALAAVGALGLGAAVIGGLGGFGTGVILAAALVPLIGVKALVPVLAVAGDRKSTRLNSSHGYISYAVFCLKKKKT